MTTESSCFQRKQFLSKTVIAHLESATTQARRAAKKLDNRRVKERHAALKQEAQRGNEEASLRLCRVSRQSWAFSQAMEKLKALRRKDTERKRRWRNKQRAAAHQGAALREAACCRLMGEQVKSRKPARPWSPRGKLRSRLGRESSEQDGPSMSS